MVHLSSRHAERPGREQDELMHSGQSTLDLLSDGIEIDAFQSIFDSHHYSLLWEFPVLDYYIHDDWFDLDRKTTRNAAGVPSIRITQCREHDIDRPQCVNPSMCSSGGIGVSLERDFDISLHTNSATAWLKRDCDVVCS